MKRLLSSMLCLLFVALSTTGCEGCDGGGVGVLAPEFRMAESIDFGAVLVGSRSTRVLVVDNVGNGRGSFRVDESSGVFVRLSPREVSLAPGTQVDVVLEVAPTTAGVLEADLLISADGDDERRVRLTADAIAAPDCDDQNDCTDEVFDLDTRACVYTQREGDCDDANACSENDRCIVGVCVGDVVECDDGVDCTIDGCDIELGCVVAVDDTRCDDGDACTRDICGADGCSAVPLPEGGRCGAGVECQVAAVCLDGVCTNVPLFEGAPCGAGDYCASENTCVAGQCEPTGETPLSGRVTSERTFLSPDLIKAAPNQGAYAQDRLFVIEDLRLSVVEVSPDAFTVTHRLSFELPTFGEVTRVGELAQVDAVTLVVSASNNAEVGLFVVDVSIPDDPAILRTVPLPNGPFRLIPDGANGVGFCVLAGASEPNWFHFAEPRTDAAPVTTHLVECESDPAELMLVGAGDTVVATSITDAGVSRRTLSFDGQETNAAIFSPTDEAPLFPVHGFQVQGQAAYFWRPRDPGPGQGALMVDVIDPVTLDWTRFHTSASVQSVAGVFRGDLLVNSNGDLVRLNVLDQNVEYVSVPIAPYGETSTVVADSPDAPLLLLGHTPVQGQQNQLRAFGVAPDNEIISAWRNGFTTSVEHFFVGEDESLTVFGIEATTRGDVASLRSTPAHPLARRALAVSALTIVYDVDEFAGAFAPVPFRVTGACAACARFYAWSPSVNLLKFSASDYFFSHLAPEGMDEGDPDFNAISVLGSRAATWSQRQSGQYLSLFDLAPNTATRRPQRLVIFPSEIEPGQLGIPPALTLHPGDLVTVAFFGAAALVDLSASPPVQLAREPLPHDGVGHSFVSAWASAEHWLVLVSGGTYQRVPLASTPVLRRTSLADGEQVQVELPADDEPSRFAYRAHILGVVDGLVYVGHTRATDAGPHHEVLLYAFDDLAAGPVHVVTLASEVIGMHVLDDGGLLIAREDGFTFLTQQCTE